MYIFLEEDRKWCDWYVWGWILKGMRSFIKIEAQHLSTSVLYLIHNIFYNQIIFLWYSLNNLILFYLRFSTFSKVGVTRELPLRCCMVKVFKHILNTCCLIKNPFFYLGFGHISCFLQFQHELREWEGGQMERIFLTKCHRWELYIFLILGCAEK